MNESETSGNLIFVDRAAAPKDETARAVRGRHGGMVSEESISVPGMAAPLRPSVVIVMGVSGSGKSTIGTLLAAHLQWEFADADRFHPPANVGKMHQGIPLTDEDRWPWRHAIKAWIDKTRTSGRCGVIACSALKRRYRDILVGECADVRLVYLKGSEELIARRIATRHGHFMPLSLLSSQFAALEEPTADERPITISIEPQPREIVTQVLSVLDVRAYAEQRL
jgi:gluconokinase